MAEQRLNQLLAVEKGLKQKAEQFVTSLYHTAQKSALFDGMSRAYKPLDAGGERLPPETKVVQQRATDILGEVARTLSELFDLRAALDSANCEASADVILPGGEIILERAPATYLLFLEKKLVDLHTIVEKLPVLDPAETWTQDANDGLFKTAASETARTVKIQEPVVLQPPTKEHPAQTALINRDVIVGYYELTKSSGALPLADQRRILRRVETLQAAVKYAREQANLVVAPKREVGQKIFDYLLSK